MRTRTLRSTFRTVLVSLPLAVVPALASAVPPDTTYILIAQQDSLPPGLEAQVAAIGGSISLALPDIGVAVATSADPAFAAGASSLPGLRSVVRDLPLLLDAGAAGAIGSGEDDDFFDMQWALDAIDAPEAWAGGARGAGVRVAVLDSGIDVDHPDLAPNLNLALSTSFIPGVGVAAPPGPPSFTGPPHHGTWVAGIIASADNGVGTIGVAPEAEIVAIRVCFDDGRCTLSAVLAGLAYAAAIDADVVNLSLQGFVDRHGFVDVDGNVVSASDVAEMLLAINRAFQLTHHERTTNIVITGNNGRDLDADADLVQLFAQSPHTIAVAATGPVGWALDPTTDVDQHACYSNYGQSVVDLAAPGGNVDCSQPFPPPPPWVLCTVVITLPCFGFDLVVGPSADGWSVGFGTSAAAPHVAGVAALVIGVHGGDMNPEAVEAALRASADDLGQPGLDGYYGHGRVNAARAIE
jgi:subtilisin family serine protease